MKLLLACSLLAASLLGGTSAFAQGVYLGPNGVGVDTGPRYHNDYDRDEYRRLHQDDEGRSVYREHRHHDDDDDE